MKVNDFIVTHFAGCMLWDDEHRKADIKLPCHYLNRDGVLKMNDHGNFLSFLTHCSDTVFHVSFWTYPFPQMLVSSISHSFRIKSQHYVGWSQFSLAHILARALWAKHRLNLIQWTPLHYLCPLITVISFNMIICIVS